MDSAHPGQHGPSGANDGESSGLHASAVAQLFHEHNRSLVSYLAVRLHSVHEAKEVAQEAYVRMLQLQKPGAESFLKAYLFRIASNLAIDRLRRRGRETRFENLASTSDVFEGVFGQPEALLLANEELQVLHACVQELPDKCRQAFVLFRMEGMSQSQIAVRLGVTDRMVRHYITHAMLYCRLRVDGLTAREARERLKQ